MYISSAEKIQLVLDGAITTSQLKYNCSYCDIASTGMVFPVLNSYGESNNTTDVDIVAAPTSGQSRVIKTITIFNSDSVSANILIKKDVSSTDYSIISCLLQVGDTLQYNEGAGWSVIKNSDQESVIFRVLQNISFGSRLANF